ncbi:methyltransferase [Parafrankia soli]|uniref:Methyltransferase n=1 Tax=Parafrankia soli TaxID=2599596 RepID=A0A1S1Q9J0_9ACTN|nr:SAM-dependent methyltransferase [Parafrankia soli]OHV30246.1 methyltransferase [Parafrankia soli]
MSQTPPPFRWNRITDELNPVDLKTDQPHSARIYDYYLGGKDNFPADREAAEQALTVVPNGRVAARQNRAFMHRATRYLAAEVGIRQFLDIGTGIPTSPNLHETAQAIAADTRVVYADNDPIVLTHARALLTGTAEGRLAYLDADLAEPERILNSSELRDTLDLTRPVALSLISVVHFLPDSADPYSLVRRYLDELPSGSYLALTHLTADFAPDEIGRMAAVYGQRGVVVNPRSRAAVERFFDGLEPVEPGVQAVSRWRPQDVDDEVTDAKVNMYGGLARKP